MRPRKRPVKPASVRQLVRLFAQLAEKGLGELPVYVANYPAGEFPVLLGDITQEPGNRLLEPRILIR